MIKQPAMLIGGYLKDYQLKGLRWEVSFSNNRLNGRRDGTRKDNTNHTLAAFLIKVKEPCGMRQFQVLLTTYEYIIEDQPILSKIQWIHMIIDERHSNEEYPE